MMDEISVINRVAIGDIIRRSASRYGGKTVLVEGDKELTYRELDDACNSFANYLIQNGYKKNDTIATMCTNSIEHVIAMYGIQKAGLIWVPINPGLSPKERRYILNKADVKMTIIDNEILQVDPSNFAGDQLLIVNKEEGALGKSFNEALVGQSSKEPDVDIKDRDIAQIMFTSGTTSDPKGVRISHLAVYFTSLSNIIDVGINKDDVQVAVLPMFHCAQHSFLTSFLTIGAKITIVKKFEPENFMEVIEKQRATFLLALPIIYRALIHHPNRSKYDISSLKTCMYAMAPMDRNTLEKGINELGADFLLGTGQTEIYPATMLFKPEEQLKRFGSYWGTTAILNDTVVMNDEGEILPKGETGEIVHRGPNVMNSYLDNEEETEASRLFGWHHTGDLGCWDEDGQMVFVDRKKDIIKTGGENVASIKVEQTLLNYEGIENVTVVGIPNEQWNEAVTAFVVTKKGANITEQEIIAYSKEHLGGFQVPKKVVFIDTIPMTTIGKVQKQILREEYATLYTEVDSVN
ncbi:MULTISPECIES: AMP-binding protein [unclassified Sporosarcina]|uniref:AMP-binding protein n=1 Tax=unclassified Sporosarcina TaxID=2647733 RepID=UPI000C1659AA|nr:MULTISPECIES: AMP-binding protein [unclassified Sporosarcina]PID03857.1 AMP-dependent synthetase [Sporosarcina sp. P30]PID07869.1 AMP-dependent synthetase [Sporosarcina sp. P31]PID10665.1 AMP-dependent synthetase [Sporosarcina sp. P32b]